MKIVVRVVGMCMLGLCALNGQAEEKWSPEKSDTWRGFTRHHFTVDNCKCWVVVPKQAAPGNPWTWCMEFPDAFTDRTGVPQLLEKGFHHVHIVVGNTFGCPDAVGHFEAFHKFLTAHGLAPKGALIGISRGGLYAYNFAAKNPGAVACIYGDAPVCDFKSWPGGQGKGKGSKGDWRGVIQHYHFRDEAEALAYKDNPIDRLKPLAEAKIPLIHVVGDADDVVPVAENTALIEKRYQDLGGTIEVHHKPNVGHHPHGLDDPKPVVEFILKHAMAVPAGAAPPTKPASGKTSGVEIHVKPDGNDQNPGTADKPLKSLAAAQTAARQAKSGGQAVTVTLHTGVYYLADKFVLTADDSGTATAPVVYRSAPGETAVLSGGQKLNLTWEPYRDQILKAKTPAGLKLDQIFINGKRQPMARYPNFDPAVAHFNGAAADAIDAKRVARWSNPAGGYIHAMHAALWGDMHWLILGKKADGSLNYEGGWQNNRASSMHKQFRFVENIFEELDAPGEWFHDASSQTLYCWPPAGVKLAEAVVEGVRLPHLLEFAGTKAAPVKFVSLQGLTFRHAARTFMDNKEPLLRSDWTVYRGGAVMLTNAEDCQITDCEFDQVGGNTIFVNKYNRRITVRGCHIHDSGASGVAFVGDPKAVRSPLFNYGQKFDYATVDRTPGPATDDYPSDCLVEDCLITKTGRFEKQTAAVHISMSQGITVRHCSIYEMPRAGININEGTFGGHLVEYCDIFDTVLETGDHGSFNSWGRDRYWTPSPREINAQVAKDPQFPKLDMVKPNILRNNRWRCDHGWDIDLDDGSSNYEIYNNVCLHGGLKLREGYHRTVYNNITVNNTLHPHVWLENSGDKVTGNIFMGAYRPAGGMPSGKWGQEVDRNLFSTNNGDRTKFAANNCDANSLVGDPEFVNPEQGDYRVKETSPALKIGFKNFSMDKFGVQKAALKSLAKQPVFPPLNGRPANVANAPAATIAWRGITARDLTGDEFSAFGVSQESPGVLIVQVAPNSPAAKAGLVANDLIQAVHGKAVAKLSQFRSATEALKPDATAELKYIRNQGEKRATVAGQ